MTNDKLIYMKINLDCADGIPMPIVRLNRWMIVVGVLVGLVTQQPAASDRLDALDDGGNSSLDCAGRFLHRLLLVLPV